MANIIEGQMDARGMKIGIVISRYNSFITQRLLEGAEDALRRHGMAEDDLTVLYVPGSFEIPLAALKMAQSGHYDAVICLGAVIRGSTPHFDFVAAECAKGIAQASMKTGVPVIFGVVTTDTIEQAVERAGTRVPNRGAEAALSAIELVNALKAMG